ncbi:L-aspartate oxidase [Halopelagius longus]|uniref:L-aspartate oxidase n=1 Tax=Halopelagius longus TaxID=1236180 RepID=A0A1H1B654_9EURY|nr:FAD-dependent oxidoreductase [Halopelagius longus]RDI70663.1 FAD-dependent oxidoreductase [Halopelagius longus]SDQ47458.1 L-aspartate oxidase [Halopelagius longus]
MSDATVAGDGDCRETDVLVVGSGIAGLAAALGAAREGADVTVATKATRPADASSWWAQGGIAVARDDPAQFKADILTASDGTAESDAVDVLVENANDAVEDVLLDTLGIEFDAAGAEYDFGREAAHDEPRILHVDASTGKHVHVPFLDHLDSRDGVTILEDTAALELLTHEGGVRGAMLERDGEVTPTFAGATVLATGGIGDLYPRSTNPDGSTGDGVAMAALAGADVADMEYVQFHPTVYAPADGDGNGDAGATDGADPFLVSEAVRGEGAVLRNAEGDRFMPDYHEDAELAPRDVVARAVRSERDATGDVVLDVSPVDFAEEFPDLAATCEDRGVEWTSGIPVAPAEHFLCGGIAVDSRGRASLDRLYAVGECARTGVHGANRLASTSLLEGLVWGLRAGEDAAGRPPERVEVPELRDSDPELPDAFASEKFVRLRRAMGECAGLRRRPSELERGRAVLRRLKGEVDAYVRTRTTRSLYELRSATVTALLVMRAASENDRSVGTHTLVEEPAEPRAE